MSQNLKVLTWAAYAVVVLLIVVPFLNVVVSVLPVRLGEVQWRFGVAGLVAKSLMSPLLGVLLALVIAALMGHRRTSRAVAVLALLGAVGGVLAVVMFGLDVVQLRPDVRVEALPRFDAAAIGAIITYSLGIIVAVLLGIGGWKAGRKSVAETAGRRARADRDEKSNVLVSSQRS